jgi:glutamine amidotransferase
LIAVIDYGAGNLKSVDKAFAKIGVKCKVTSDPDEALRADGLVLPGVGAFGETMQSLSEIGMIPAIKEFIGTGKPFLGICLGLQVLFSESEEVFGGEAGLPKGLDLVGGRVVRFPQSLKVPQIGWNQLTFNKNCPLFKGINDGAFAYFVHSYYVVPDDPKIVACSSDYGLNFTAGIWKDNIYAVQFHPEKSSAVGLSMLKNFGELVDKCS